MITEPKPCHMYVTLNDYTYITGRLKTDSLNCQKTCFMTFTNRIITDPPIKINNTNRVDIFESKFHGIIIDTKL